MYIEIKNNSIVQHHASLPQSYNNISNFYALADDPEKLYDLSWSGNIGVKFYPYINNIPTNIPENHVLVGPTYTIDHENHRVIGDYTIESAPEIPQLVPDNISARQIRMWLVSHGVSLSAIESAIDQIEDIQQRDLVKVEWEYAPYIERSYPMLVPIAAILGFTEEQIDQAFIEGNLL